MRKNLLALLLFLCIIGLKTYAQDRTITGTVKGKDDGLPLPGVSIVVKGTRLGAQTSVEGKYSIKIPTSATVLTFTYLGYVTQDVTISRSNVLDVTLELTAQSLSEVKIVGTALGAEKTKEQTGYSTSKVDNAVLTQAHTPNISSALSGKVSGLVITNANNGLNESTRLVLRGIRSLTGNNQPLLVIDGLPVDLAYLNSINPNDVADINVLKGAASSALYGPDGVNGVIVVSTKRGSSTKKPEISVGNTTYIEKVAYLPDLQHKFGSGSSTDAFGNGIYDPIENQSWGPKYNGAMVRIGRVNEAGAEQLVEYTDQANQKMDFWNTGGNIQNDISVSAGDATAKFYVSGQHLERTSSIIGDRSYRKSARVNADKKMGMVTVGTSIQYAGQRSDVTSANIYNLVIQSPGHIPLTTYSDYTIKDLVNPLDPKVNTYNWADHNHYYNDYYANPYEAKDNSRSYSKNTRFVGSLDLAIKPLKWLTFKNKLGYNLNSSTSKSTTKALFYTPLANLRNQSRQNTFASVSDGEGFSEQIQNDFNATATKRFGDFDFNLFLQNTIRENYSKSVDVSGGALAIPTLFNVGVYTGIPGVGENFTRRRLFSYLGSFRVGYKDFATVEFTGRNDKDSRLPLDNNSYFYPGASLSVIASNIFPIIKKGGIIDQAKLRVAWNKTGNVNLGTYALQTTYDSSSGFPYGALPSYTSSTSLRNPNIRPETVEGYEVGGEFSFLKDRVTFETSYYKSNNNNQVISISLSRATGFASTTVNAAEFKSWGYEMDLGLAVVKSPKVRWNLNGNLAMNDSKVYSLYQGLDFLGIGSSAFVIVGYPAYTHRITDFQRDPEGRVVVNPATGYPILGTTPTSYGRNSNKYTMGINTDVSYNNFTLRAVAEYRTGGYVINSIGQSYAFTGNDRLSGINDRQRFVFPNSSYTLDGGTTYIPNKDIVLTSANIEFLSTTSFTNAATSYYTSAAFWKLREVSLSYDLPQKLLAKTKVIRKTTLSLTGRNLLAFRPSTNWWTDPEFGSTGNDTGTASLSQTPPTRQFGFNVNVTF